MAEYIYGGKGVLFWVTQLATFAILILAANTAYADFPRLSSIIARDGFLPRQLANRGDRLVFSNGIIFLAVDGRDPDRRLQGQHLGAHPALRVRRVHRLHAEPGRHGRAPLPAARAAMAGVGRRSTPSAAWPPGIVAIVVVVSKFTEGAWIPAVLIPLLVVGFRAIGKHYRRVRKAVAVDARLQAAAPHAPRRGPRRHASTRA